MYCRNKIGPRTEPWDTSSANDLNGNPIIEHIVFNNALRSTSEERPNPRQQQTTNTEAAQLYKQLGVDYTVKRMGKIKIEYVIINWNFVVQ